MEYKWPTVKQVMCKFRGAILLFKPGASFFLTPYMTEEKAAKTVITDDVMSPTVSVGSMDRAARGPTSYVG